MMEYPEKGLEMTTQHLVEKIHEQYPHSPDFLQAVIEAGKNNYASSGETSLATLIAKLGSQHRNICGTDGQMLLVSQFEKFEKAKEEWQHAELHKESYRKGLQFASMVTAIYHGEIELVNEKGEFPDSFTTFRT
jgi:hypothetical protein